MLPDLISLAQEDEFQVPVILRPVDLRKRLGTLEREGRETELFFEDSICRTFGRLPDEQVAGRKHPPLAVRLGPLGVQGADVIPRGRRVQPPHQDSFRMPLLADDYESRETNSAFRDLVGCHLSRDRIVPTELAVRCHGPGTSSLRFQPSASRIAMKSAVPTTFISSDHVRRIRWRATCTSSAPRDPGNRRWSTPSSFG